MIMLDTIKDAMKALLSPLKKLTIFYFIILIINNNNICRDD